MTGAHSSRSTIAAAAATIQAAAGYDQLEGNLLSAGFTILRYAGDHGTGDIRSAVFRFPSVDQIDGGLLTASCNDPAILMVTTADRNGALPGQLNAWVIYDVDVHNNPGNWTDIGNVLGSRGDWTTGAQYPTLGTPDRIDQINDTLTPTAKMWQLIFDGSSVYEFFSVASMYGLGVAAITGTPADCYAGWSSRALFDYERKGRRIQVVGYPTAAVAPGAYPMTFAEPTGTEFGTTTHLRIACEGVIFTIRFPTRALGAVDICREINRQTGGFCEAVPVDAIWNNIDNEQGDVGIAIRIPEARSPAGDYSTEQPQIAIEYMDPTVVAAGLNFARRILVGTATSVATGAGDFIAGTGLLRFGVANGWFADQVRLGATVYNVTKNTSAKVTGFTTGAATYDTLILTLIPPGPAPPAWLTSDTYYILPGPSDHRHGVLPRYGASYLAVDSVAPLAQTVQGATETFILNDHWNSGLDENGAHRFEVGQTVMVSNNANAVILNLTGVPTAFTAATAPQNVDIMPGDTILVTAGPGIGSYGYVLAAVDNGGGDWDVVVDTIRGASGNATPYKVAPFNGASADTVSILRLGTATVGAGASINTVTSSESGGGPYPTGWMQRATVTAVGDTVSATDTRKTVSLGLAAAGINTAMRLFPGFVLGIHGKHVISKEYDMFQIATTQGNYSPTIEGGVYTDPDLRDQSVRTHKQNQFGSAASPDEPNWQHKNLGSTHLGVRILNNRVANERAGIVAHLKTVTARGTAPAQFDEMREEADPTGNVIWRTLETNDSGANVGAAMTGNTTIWPMIGPGKNL